MEGSIMIRAWVSSLSAVAALAACSREEAGLVPPPEDLPAAIALRDPGGRILANATVDEASGLRVRVESATLVAGTYAVHLHQNGLCQPPAFESAGPHWNPSGRQHGRLNPLGPHLGDLPNLTVGADGRGTVEFTIAAASLARGDNRLADRDGAALVVHAGPDDYRTDPSGNSGARLACGVVVPPR
jgi:superoxide dismutase, Cu-Zn family